MVKYATAIRTGTASTDAILRRFTRNASHPTYAAKLEIGRAEKTAFLSRYLRVRDMQREVNDGLNVMESWNGANDIIHFGRRGDINTLMIRGVGKSRAMEYMGLAFSLVRGP